MENGRTPQTRYAIDCDHAALVITDCQNDFLSPGESIVNNGDLAGTLLPVSVGLAIGGDGSSISLETDKVTAN